MAIDGDIVGGAPLVTQTPTVVVVAQARQPQPEILPQDIGQKAQGPGAETRVTTGLMQGGRVQAVTEIWPLFHVLDARVGLYG